jgi:hypothetical protein
MRDGIEIRPNGIQITKGPSPSGHHSEYRVDGSRNGPWTYLRNARNDADNIDEQRN